MYVITQKIPWKKILEILVAVLTALLGTIGIVSCL
ncbi:MAG: smalltalk protein [Bacteroidaceae bacterium]|nr:smalltalk protein [Bacteroidaceae bacterium]